jgi:hypothetical protein
VKKVKALLNRANEKYSLIGKIVSRGTRKVIYN